MSHARLGYVDFSGKANVFHWDTDVVLTFSLVLGSSLCRGKTSLEEMCELPKEN